MKTTPEQIEAAIQFLIDEEHIAVVDDDTDSARSFGSLREMLVELQKERDEAYERAAMIAEQHFIYGHAVAGPSFAAKCAKKIRALKSKPDAGTDTDKAGS